ncbi:type VI secretion system baseplate subunit TssG [Enterobacter cancerogenus]|uniref:type VI secretion system baseplate subunit TssG n=1 Tax=Enterobacter cancerogenus TaxID=69218 RepID=UPI000C9BCB8E|nr:type VI secretion system baseplate subunit TssG [Enterobacter cancerogenus]PNF10785.1 type VI secretion system baseplate subunit TssG [Enterobacter cancerogenus]QGG07971.1 type VI secretion system baseplate subunit TssG [Enterobacter cancerogenus]
MAGEPQPPHSRLSERLERDIHRINFYRFCQLLEKTQPDALPLGSTLNPTNDPVRFRPHPGMGFPASELKTVEYDDDNPDAPPTVRTTFMGLYGVESPLPTHYIDDIAQQREGHDAQEAFLDIFNHRILTQFYRIWRKYSYPATFEAGGRDRTSQSLLGLIGLGIPGTERHAAAPMSRFLALLSVMRLPARTEEGIRALVKLLAPRTQAIVTPYCPRAVHISRPLGFYGDNDFLLDGYTVLGDETTEVSSQLLIALHTEDYKEAQGWLPDGHIYADFLVLLRVYLGWRYKARIQLSVPTPLLPAPVLGETPFILGMSGVLGMEGETVPPDLPDIFTFDLGGYCGMPPATLQKGNLRVAYYVN